MKPRWLLLAASLICLLVLAPASALSVAGYPAGCGTCEVDGVLEAEEWETAIRLPMAGEVRLSSEELGLHQQGAGDAAPAGKLDLIADVLLMNDETHLCVGYEGTLDSVVADPGHWKVYVDLGFTDEADPLDDEWAAGVCGEMPHEGWYSLEEWVSDLEVGRWNAFSPVAEEPGGGKWCPEIPMGPGVAYAAAPGRTASMEVALDLDDSYLDKVGPGDCFLFGTYLWMDTEIPDRYQGRALWPGSLWQTYPEPPTFGIICLDPCEPPVVVEDFVPEPATMMLLGSGLMGLAGYAGLRLRKK